MTEEDVRAISAHLDEIAKDPKGWLDAFGPYALGPASEMLRKLAETLSNREHLAEELAYDEWCQRYGLDAGQNLTRFLRGLCKQTIGEIRDRLKISDERALRLVEDVAYLMGAVKRLGRPASPPEIIDYHFNSVTPVTEAKHVD
jgi:hypothetical protein